MLRSAKDIVGYGIEALDGGIGKVNDLYFDDSHWNVRYVIANTHNWLPGRKVLLSPAAVRMADGTTKTVHVTLKKQQIETCPPIAADEPVSRRQEAEVIKHFGWQGYWPGGAFPRGGTSGAEDISTMAAGQAHAKGVALEEREANGNPHLRSLQEVMGYHIQATDDEFGHLMDMVLDDETWEIRYLVVDTRNWFPGGKKVLISPAWITDVDWVLARIEVSLPKERIKNSPKYDPSQPVNREYEARLYDYYGRPKYWV